MGTRENSNHNAYIDDLVAAKISFELLLKFIIERYTGKVFRVDVCKDVVDKDRELLELLQQASVKGTYGHIIDLPPVRNLIGTQSQPSKVMSTDITTRDIEEKATIEAWRVKFEGDNHKLLVECLRAMNKDRSVPNSRPYMNFTSIVQSSGMGKSRTVDEASRLIFSLPFNLRDVNENAYYPTPDTSVRSYFLNIRKSDDYTAVRIHYLRFVAHLFRIVADEVQKMDIFPDLEHLASAWRNQVFDANQHTRSTIYAAVVERASRDTASEKAVVKLANSNLKFLLDIIDNKCVNQLDKGDLRIILYFDEAHYLTETGVTYKDKESSDSGVEELRTLYMALCSVLDELKDHALMGLFLSTSSRLTKFAPPRSAFWSDRVVGEKGDLQTPFVELPYRDPEEECLIEGAPEMSLDTFCSIENLASLSRPLFKTRYKVLQSRINIARFAKFKLCNGLEDAYNDETFIAVVTCRVMAEFPLHQISPGNIDSVRQLDEKLVAAHMRTVYSIPEHREFMRTGYSSEPLLAEVAAQVMCEHPAKTRTAFTTCLTNELIGRGERGEAIVRYLSILAFDKARNWDKREFFSKPIPLLDFLEALFGNGNYDQIKTCQAHNVVGGGALLEDAFRNAYIYFTHFARAEDSTIISDTCALTALSRGMAWQCYQGQEDIDILFPVVFLEEGKFTEPLDRTKVSFMAFQVKNRKKAESVEMNPSTLNAFWSTGDDIPKKPHIAVVLELGVAKVPDESSRVKMRAPPSRGKDTDGLRSPCYFFTVYGCDGSAYGVIGRGENEGLFSGLLSKGDLLNDHPRKDGFLKALINLDPFWSASLCQMKLKASI